MCAGPDVDTIRHHSCRHGAHPLARWKVTSKIEDGKLKPEIRTILSEDRPADDDTRTLQALRGRHHQMAIHQASGTSRFWPCRLSLLPLEWGWELTGCQWTHV